MSQIGIELLVILLLLLVNGLLAMTEMAVVSARKARLRRLADQGDQRASAALALAESPNRFLSTVQIGITLVGVLAGAFGGATIAKQITAALEPISVLAPYAEAIGVVVVVVAITHWLQNVEDVRQKHTTQLATLGDEAQQVDRLCELNVLEQVASVCEATSVQNAWASGQPLAVHGWIYAVNDGLLRDLGLCVAGPGELAPAYQAAVAGRGALLIPAGFIGDVAP